MTKIIQEVKRIDPQIKRLKAALKEANASKLQTEQDFREMIQRCKGEEKQRKHWESQYWKIMCEVEEKRQVEFKARICTLLTALDQPEYHSAALASTMMADDAVLN